MSEIVELDDHVFFEFIAEHQVVVIDFFATWCAPCTRMLKILPNLIEQLDGKANIGKIDIDKFKGIAEMYDVKAVPTFLFFKDGNLKERLVGVKTLIEIKQMAESLLEVEHTQ